MEIQNIDRINFKVAGINGSAKLRAVSEELEATFISEILKQIQPNTSGSNFSGGIGEEKFKSFLLDKQAELITRRGGLGLSEHFYNSLHKVS